MDKVINDLKDVFELATGAVALTKEILKLKSNKKDANKDKLIKVSKGDYAQIGSSGDYAQIGSSGDYAKIGSSGYSAQIGSSGYHAQIGSSGDYAQIGSSGYYAKIGSSGYHAQIGSSGDSARIGSSGDYAKIGSSGDYAKIGSSGDYAKIGSSGDSARIGSSGDYAQIGSSGYHAKIGSSGDYAQIDSEGNNAVISAIGLKSIAKGKIGSWITLAEYKRDENDNWVVDFVKTEYIDGNNIKEDTYYTLYNHEFMKVEILDEVKTIILNRKKNVIKGLYLDSLNPCYVVEKDGIFSHGDTLKEAKESLIYKISNRDTSMYKDYTLDSVVTFEEAIKMYRVITGACEAGTRNFVQGLTKKKKKYTVKEVIDITQGQYGNKTFSGFFAECGGVLSKCE